MTTWHNCSIIYFSYHKLEWLDLLFSYLHLSKHSVWLATNQWGNNLKTKMSIPITEALWNCDIARFSWIMKFSCSNAFYFFAQKCNEYDKSQAKIHVSIKTRACCEERAHFRATYSKRKEWWPIVITSITIILKLAQSDISIFEIMGNSFTNFSRIVS